MYHNLSHKTENLMCQAAMASNIMVPIMPIIENNTTWQIMTVSYVPWHIYDMATLVRSADR